MFRDSIRDSLKKNPPADSRGPSVSSAAVASNLPDSGRAATDSPHHDLNRTESTASPLNISATETGQAQASSVNVNDSAVGVASPVNSSVSVSTEVSRSNTVPKPSSTVSTLIQIDEDSLDSLVTSSQQVDVWTASASKSSSSDDSQDISMTDVSNASQTSALASVSPFSTSSTTLMSVAAQSLVPTPSSSSSSSAADAAAPVSATEPVITTTELDSSLDDVSTTTITSSLTTPLHSARESVSLSLTSSQTHPVTGTSVTSQTSTSAVWVSRHVSNSYPDATRQLATNRATKQSDAVDAAAAAAATRRSLMDVLPDSTPVFIVCMAIGCALLVTCFLFVASWFVSAKRSRSYLSAIPSPINRRSCVTAAGTGSVTLAVLTAIVILHFFRSGAEWTFFGLMPSFVEEQLGWKRSTASLLAATFWLSSTVGRLIGTWGLSSFRLRPWMVMFVGLACGFTSLAAVATTVSHSANVEFLSWWRPDSGTSAVLWIGTAFFGLGTSFVAPAAERYLPPGACINIAAVVGSSVGEMIVPVLSGTLSAAYGSDWIVNTIFAAVAGGLAVCLVLWCVVPVGGRQSASQRVKLLGESIETVFSSSKGREDIEGAATDTNEEEDAELLSSRNTGSSSSGGGGASSALGLGSHFSGIQTMMKIGVTAKKD